MAEPPLDLDTSPRSSEPTGPKAATAVIWRATSSSLYRLVFPGSLVFPECMQRLVLAIVLSLALFGCSKADRYNSNFPSVRIESATIVDAKSAKPYSGKLIARDEQIAAVARAVLGPNRDLVAGTALTGLVLVMPVKDGVPEGTAVVLVDLKAPKLNPELGRRSEFELDVARAVSPTIKIAEATFRAGKLDGVAAAYGPASASLSMEKVAEATFRDHQLDGVAREFFHGNKVRREYNFARGVQNGVQKIFHDNGKLARATPFEHGASHGESKAFYATGAPRGHGTYDRGKPTGTHVTLFPNGKPEAEVTYAPDAPMVEKRWFSTGQRADEPPNGVIEEYYATGNVQTRLTYVSGVKAGPFEQFYSDGKKWKAGTYAQGELDGRYEEWWRNGKPAVLATYVSGKLTGQYARYYANGRTWELAMYSAGTRVGEYKKWWKNGKLAHVYTYTQEGRLDGEYKQFYDNGAKWVEARYANGKPQGAIQRWYPDGKLGYVLHHEHGRPHGAFKRWYGDGKPRLEASYVKGTFDGEFKNWNADGTVFEMATYQRGLLVRSTRGSADTPPP